MLNKAPARSALRGFTLIELMVALTAALFFTIFVFMLSRDVSRFFQGQARLSESTLATITGFERLRADIARAGYLASPNLARDRNRCPRNPSGTVTAPQQSGMDFSAFPGLQQMGLLRIVPSTAATYGANVVLDENGATGILPDSLVLYGNYTTAEQFPIERISWTGAQPQIFLERDSVVLRRLGIIEGTTTDANALGILQSIFRPGQLLRLVDTTGREQYALIQNVALNTTTTRVPVIVLDNAITLIRKDSGGLCGIRSVCTGCVVNPVDIIRYEMVEYADATNPAHGHLDYLYQGAAPPYENTRLDLYRYRLSPTTSNSVDAMTSPGIPPTAEVVAEYAVDLRFGLSVVGETANGQLDHLPEGDARIQNYAGVPYAAPANGVVTASQTYGPHFIRGVSVRLNVRNREGDRTAPIVLDAAATSDQLYRVKVKAANGTTGEEALYARMRTLRSQVATRNTQNLMWN